MWHFISYPKINICFKIIGLLENNYCDIESRFVRVKGDVFDELEISPAPHFEIIGLDVENNTILRAKNELTKELVRLESSNPRMESLNPQTARDSHNFRNPKKSARFLERFKIRVNKKIPLGAGLGGGSSNAATYLLAMNEILELNLGTETLSRIAQKIGADVVFFVYDVNSANVRGFGEKVEAYSENLPEFEIFTPKLECSTAAVYAEFKRRAVFSTKNMSTEMLAKDSREILKNYQFSELNDLFKSAAALYPELNNLAREGLFFSGSGSSFFSIKEGEK